MHVAKKKGEIYTNFDFFHLNAPNKLLSTLVIKKPLRPKYLSLSSLPQHSYLSQTEEPPIVGCLSLQPVAPSVAPSPHQNSTKCRTKSAPNFGATGACRTKPALNFTCRTKFLCDRFPVAWSFVRQAACRQIHPRLAVHWNSRTSSENNSYHYVMPISIGSR